VVPQEGQGSPKMFFTKQTSVQPAEAPSEYIAKNIHETPAIQAALIK